MPWLELARSYGGSSIKQQKSLDGRVQVYRANEGGRVIKMIGLERIAASSGRSSLICDATGDAKISKAIWPNSRSSPGRNCHAPRACTSCSRESHSKYAVSEIKKQKSEGNEKELERKAEGARRMYAALLLKAMEYGGSEVAAIVCQSSTREWIEKNCYVPPWLKLAHHGAITGTNAFANVAALFEVGRMQPPPEAVVQQSEALFGHYVAQREYMRDGTHSAGAQRGARYQYRGHQSTSTAIRWCAACCGRRGGASIQTLAGLGPGCGTAPAPLHIHRWSDLPTAELGPVEPVLWSEVEAGLDGLMLAVAGVWLHCIPDAIKAFPDLFTENGLESARRA